MKSERQTIFISYSWANTSLANIIDKAFQPTGLIIKRDVRELPYKGSIKEYMRQVRSTDFVLLIISGNFLKSSNCMYEVLELLKDTDFKQKVLPIIVDDTRIFNPQDRLEYVKFWTEQHTELEQKLKCINPTDAIELYKDLKHYEKIRASMDEFLGILSDLNSPFFSDFEKDNFQKIFDYIGVSDRVLINEVLSLKDIVTDEEKDIEIDKLGTKYPNNPKIYFVKGYYAFERNEISKSNYFYRKAIDLDPLFSATYYNLGFNAEVYDRDIEEAKKLYEKAIELEPDNTKAYINLARLFARELRLPIKAKQLLERALEINQYDATAHYNLALTLQLDFDDYKLAKYHYELAIKFKPDFVDAKHNYGMLLWKKYQCYSDSKEQFLEVLELDPNNKMTLKQLGSLLEIEYKHFTTAKIYYEKFIIIEPNTADDHYWYSSFLMLHFLSSEKALARLHYEIACSQDSSLRSEDVESLLS